MSRFDEMRQAIAEAQQTFNAADRTAGTMAHLLCGRLRHVPSHHLAALKAELREFNAHTGRWKS